MFRAVTNRCALYPSELKLPVSWDEAVHLLKDKGFRVLTVDVEAIARSCVGMSAYRRGARLREAPAVVDCSSLSKWAYGRLGIWLPRRSIQQRQMGTPIEIDDLRTGDLVFVTGSINYYDQDPANGIGHLGIATSRGTVIHAANRKAGVIEEPLERLLKRAELRGVRRIIDRPSELIILESPLEREVETSDDIRWIVLQSLSPLDDRQLRS